MHMNVRVVVADERQANFFDTHQYGAPLALRASLENPAGGLRDTDLETDRPGRRAGGASPRDGGGAGGSMHGVNGERSTEQHELSQFAKAVAQRIHTDRANQQFDRLIIVAGPKMLGLLRQELPESCRHTLVGEIPKDLMKQGLDAVRGALPRDAFFQ
jgi:protein required for attachment to host cells